MPKLYSSVPRCRFHKGTGQAVVRLHGRGIYPGKHGTAASKEAYKRFVAEWSENDGRLPDSPHTTTVTEMVLHTPSSPRTTTGRRQAHQRSADD